MRVIISLHLDYRSLQTCQDLLCLRQPQPQVRDIAESTERSDIRYVDDSGPGLSNFISTKRKTHAIRKSPSQLPIGQSYRLRPHPPTRWTPPLAPSDVLSRWFRTSDSRCCELPVELL